MARTKTTKNAASKSPTGTKKRVRLDDMTMEERQEHEAGKLEARNWKPLIDQIEREYRLAYDNMKPKWDEWEVRLKLYNNQKRDKEAIGDPLIFTIHQSVLAALYTDRLTSSFEAREDGDYERTEQLNPMAEFDYDEMEKDIIDYDWDWDTLFFGVGYTLMMEFDGEAQVPVPEVLDPMTVLMDPWAKSTQGVGRKHAGAAQFFGWEAGATIRELKDAGVYFNLKNLKQDTGADPIRSLIDRNHDARNEAHGLANVRNKSYQLLGDNRRHRVLNWITWYNGDLCFVTLAEDRSKVIRFQKLPRKIIPVVQRNLFPISHELHGVSIPDLVEDKQRARAVLQNLALKKAKLDVLPRYLYNSLKIKNRRDLDPEFNKHIAIEGDPSGAITPVQTNAVKAEVQYILDLLDTSAQRATATPEQQQGVPSTQRRTLGELQLVDANVDTRYSLAARIFGWSEKRFWQEWYFLYKEYFADTVDEKMVRIAGVGGPSWKKLTRENIIATVDPDVKIESKVIVDSERRQELATYRAYVGDIIADPNANVRYAFKHLGKLSGLRRDHIDRLLPQTPDELQADAENEALAKNQKAVVLPTDDDLTHLIMHDSAPDTPAKYAHINAHKRALLLKKTRPELFDQQGAFGMPDAGGGGMNPTDRQPLPAGGGVPQRAVRQETARDGAEVDLAVDLNQEA